MKLIVLFLGLMASGCGKCAYGYSSACDVDWYQEQQRQEKENKEKKEKAPTNSWH